MIPLHDLYKDHRSIFLRPIVWNKSFISIYITKSFSCIGMKRT